MPDFPFLDILVFVSVFFFICLSFICFNYVFHVNAEFGEIVGAGEHCWA